MCSHILARRLRPGRPWRACRKTTYPLAPTARSFRTHNTDTGLVRPWFFSLPPSQRRSAVGVCAPVGHGGLVENSIPTRTDGHKFPDTQYRYRFDQTLVLQRAALPNTVGCRRLRPGRPWRTCRKTTYPLAPTVGSRRLLPVRSCMACRQLTCTLAPTGRGFPDKQYTYRCT